MRKFFFSLFTIGFSVFGLDCVAQTVTGQVGGHDYVDLGLPSGLKWATCNVGANKSTEQGAHLAWGEIDDKNDYSWKSYALSGIHLDSLKKYCSNSEYGTVDNKAVLEAADDAAIVNWGEKWRIPTSKEQRELLDGCIWEWTNDFNGSGVAGRVGTSKTNGNTIFLPAAGYAFGKGVFNAGEFGYYWSSSLCKNYSRNADVLVVRGILTYSDNWDRMNGLSVRAVSNAKDQKAIFESLSAPKIAIVDQEVQVSNVESNCKIQVIDLFGKVVSSGTTDSNGAANITIPSVLDVCFVTFGNQSIKVVRK